VAKDRGQGGREVIISMDLTTSKMVENLTKMAELLPRYQVLLIWEKPASPPSTAVSHNCVLNALTGSRLRRLMR